MRIEFSKGVFEAFHYNVEQGIGEVAAGRIGRVPMCACVCFRAWRMKSITCAGRKDAAEGDD